MIRKIVYGFLCASLVCIALVTILLILQNRKLKTAIEIVTKQSTNLQHFVDSCQAKEQRIQDMVTTIVEAYPLTDLSPHETRYYCILIDDFAQRYNIPWEVYIALIRMESNFDPTHKSDKDCRGMMQLLESTGRDVAKTLGIRYRDTKTCWYDVVNMILGCTYFSEEAKKEADGKPIQAAHLKHAIRFYLGGPDYPRKVGDNQQYIGEYSSSVWSETSNLHHMFKGIQISHTDSMASWEEKK